MTTIAEDLKTTIDADFNDGTVTETVHVFMKTNQDTTMLEPPDTPAVNKATIVIMEGIGIPIRRSKGADLIVYEGDIYVYTNTYATMILTIAELKQIADDLTTGTGNLSFTVPAIHGERERTSFIATMKYTWEKVTNRG